MDFIFNQAYLSFLSVQKKRMCDILQQEMNVEYQRTRFVFQDRLIPLDLIIFEDNSKLGFYDRHSYKIALNKKLILHNNQTDIDNILRHELAHVMTKLKYPGSGIHDILFREVCQSYGWGKDVWHSRENINIQSDQYNLEKNLDQIIVKLQKLLNLSGSDNVNEANLALMKANQLLLKYNLENLELKKDQQDVYLRRIISGKRSNKKHSAISDILKTFYVFPIYNYGADGFYLEIIGSKANVELAEYVSNFLDFELERLWLNYKQLSNRSGITAKNSFMKGIALGYLDKIELLKSSYTKSETKALSTINSNLEKELACFYPKMISKRTSTNICLGSLEAGITKGNSLSISPALNDNKSKKLFLLN